MLGGPRRKQLAAQQTQTEAERPLALGPMLTELQRLGLAPQTADRLRKALQTMDRAAHGLDVESADASEATEVATAFLAELRRSAIADHRDTEYLHPAESDSHAG